MNKKLTTDDTSSLTTHVDGLWTNRGTEHFKAYQNLLSAYREYLSLPEIAQAIGKDHVQKTPMRVIKALAELLEGYTKDPKNLLETSFQSGKYNQMITVANVNFTSLCAHHMLPFSGQMHFAYIPKGRIVGLSKIPRIMEAFSRRLQVQEHLGEEIVDCFQKVIKPRGCAIMIEAHHLCASIRGVKKEALVMKTTALRGIFTTDVSAKAEFLQGIK